MDPNSNDLLRRLYVDADNNQLVVGSQLRLRLQLDTDNPNNPLPGVVQPAFSVWLKIDRQGDGHPSFSYRYDYELDADEEAYECVNSPTRDRFLFGHLSAQPLNLLSDDLTRLELTWDVSSWDMLGTFLFSGHLAAGRPLVEVPAEMPRAEPGKGGKTGRKVEVRGQSANSFERDFGGISLQVVMPAAQPVIMVSTPPAPELPLPLPVTLTEAGRHPSPDQLLWSLIRRRSLNFTTYRTFIDAVLCDATPTQARQLVAEGVLQRPAFNRLASYSLLKQATEYFLLQETALAFRPDTLPSDLDERLRLGGTTYDPGTLKEAYLEELGNGEGKALPYFHIIRERLKDVKLKQLGDLGWAGDTPYYGILPSRLQDPPLIELLWSYWHEEGGLVQTMNAISLRFQNVRRPGPGPDPLAGLNLDPLRPMSNLLWGYIEDERNRLSLNRRNLEYQYEYGFGLIGRGVQPVPPAENRTFFLRGFHTLLRACAEFYQQANFTTVIPDGFPLLNCLREVHMTLAEGAHNQYGDLPWTARAEMLIQQWLLARPEVREFLGGRIMVPYTEPWMDRVDAMKALQGWNPANASHFHDLGAMGEQLLLSIRYGAWNSPQAGALNAANWAHYWREEIQRYLHAYKAVTGVDLATDLGDARQSLPDNPERYQTPAQLIERQKVVQQSQLRAGRPAGPTLGPLRQPAFAPRPSYPALDE